MHVSVPAWLLLFFLSLSSCFKVTYFLWFEESLGNIFFVLSTSFNKKSIFTVFIVNFTYPWNYLFIFISYISIKLVSMKVQDMEKYLRHDEHKLLFIYFARNNLNSLNLKFLQKVMIFLVLIGSNYRILRIIWWYFRLTIKIKN